MLSFQKIREIKSWTEKWDRHILRYLEFTVEVSCLEKTPSQRAKWQE